MRVQEAQSLLDDIDNNGSSLTDWEIDFVEDMLRKTDNMERLTVNEAAKLQEIHDERT
jgi:hypothetical protein